MPALVPSETVPAVGTVVSIPKSRAPQVELVTDDATRQGVHTRLSARYEADLMPE